MKTDQTEKPIPDEGWGIVANVVSDRTLRTGAKVWILGQDGNAETAVVLGLDKSGHKVRKFTKYKRLTNFRAAWIPPERRHEVESPFQYSTKEEAQKSADGFAAMWEPVRAMSRDGTQEIKPGITISEAYERRRQEYRRQGMSQQSKDLPDTDQS